MVYILWIVLKRVWSKRVLFYVLNVEIEIVKKFEYPKKAWDIEHTKVPYP